MAKNSARPQYPKMTAWQRLHLVVENSTLQVLFGVVGGSVGTFLDGRYFAVLALCVIYALFRSDALKGIRTLLVVPIYLITLTCSSALLYFMGTKLNHSRSHVFTPDEYAQAVRKGIPLPITRQVQNVYNSYTQKAPQEAVKEPRIDFDEWKFAGAVPTGLQFYTNAVNNGLAPALDVRGTVKAQVLPISQRSEDEVFAFIYKHALDEEAPRFDVPPGRDYEKKEVIPVDTATELEKWQLSVATSALYLGRADVYHDARNNLYISELCMFMVKGYSSLTFCNRHNGSRRVKKGELR